MEDGTAKITDESGRILLDHLALDRVYKLVETKAPEGYELAEDMEIVIEETAELQEFTTSDKPKKPEAPEKPEEPQKPEDKPKPENGGSEDDNAPAPGQGGLPNTGTAAAAVIITGRKKKVSKTKEAVAFRSSFFSCLV